MTDTLIPRKILFGNPTQANLLISPDGTQISYLAPVKGVLNVWVAPREDPSAARPVTADSGRGIHIYFWAFNNQHILYMQDKDGDENYRLYTVQLASGEVKCLTPYDGVQSRPETLSHKFPNEIIASINNRVPQLHDLYRINLETGKSTLIEENPGFMGYSIDDDLRVRMATRMTADGGLEIFQKAPDGWILWDVISPEDILTTGLISFDKTGEFLYLNDSRGRDTSALFMQNLATKEKYLLAEDPLADVGDVLIHPTEKTIQAVSFIYDRKRWQVLDPTIKEDLAYLNDLSKGEIQIVSRTLDDHYWVVMFHKDDHPTHYYIYDRRKQEAQFIFSSRPELEEYTMTPMHSAVIQSRDGLDLVVYYSLPVGSDSDGDGIPDQPLPAVLYPHGGPWGRDYWGFNNWHQWLANRGYAVINVNFRSSTGFGKAFINAGDKEWGRKIIEDQADAVGWAVQQGIADPQRFAIMGGSFGGYSTLAGITLQPELYCCGVDLFGPANLITLLETIPPYWKPQLELFTTRVGDHRTEEGRALLKKHSPLTYVENIQCPLLIGQGSNDARVKQAESDQIVQAMKERGIPVTYVLYPDEGHGFARPENNLSFSAISEAFLAKEMGGSYQPIGEDLQGSSLKVLVGAEGIPGLTEALK